MSLEQHGDRYGVVVQAQEFLPRLVVVVAPRSRSAKQASFRPEIDLGGQKTQVLVEQLGAVDATRLDDLSGHLSPQELWGVDEAISTILGLN